MMREKQKNVQNTPAVESEYSVTETIEVGSMNRANDGEIREVPKKKLNGLVFFLNIISMLFFCHVSPYYIFAPRSQGETKGIVAGCSIGLSIIITFPTFIYLTTLKQLLQLAFLIDTIMLVTVSGVIAFVNMILLFDKGGTWHYPLIEISFSLTVFVYSTMVRVLLLTLDWSKWQLIVFKLHLMVNCMMFFISGVYFIYIDFTYTNHKLKSFDDKVHQFMVLFIFTMFGWLYEMYSKVTDLDRTGDLRYVYKLKNMDQTRQQKKKEIIKKRKESKNSIRLLEQSEMMKKAVQQYAISRFSNIEVVNSSQ